MNTCWVGQLPHGISEDAVHRIFEKECGPVKSVSVKNNHEDTFAFVQFGDPLGFEKALAFDKNTDAFGGKPLKVNFVKNAGYKPDWQTGEGSGAKGGGSKGSGSKGGWSGGGGSWDKKASWDKNSSWEGGNSWWSGGKDSGKGDGKRGQQRPWDRDMGAHDEPVDASKIWVGSLPAEVTEDEITMKFEKFGVIENIKLVPKEGDVPPHAFAFITFMKERDAQRALEKMNGSEEFGNPIKVKTVLPKSNTQASKAPVREEGRGSFTLRLRSRSRSPALLEPAPRKPAPRGRGGIGYGYGDVTDDEAEESVEEDEESADAAKAQLAKARGRRGPGLAAVVAAAAEAAATTKSRGGRAVKMSVVKKTGGQARAAAARAALTPAAKVAQVAMQISDDEVSESEAEAEEASESAAPEASEAEASEQPAASSAAASRSPSPEAPEPPPRRAAPAQNVRSNRRGERDAEPPPRNRGKEAETSRRESGGNAEAPRRQRSRGARDESANAQAATRDRNGRSTGRNDRRDERRDDGRERDRREAGRAGGDRGSSRADRGRLAKDDRPKARSRSRDRPQDARGRTATIRIDNLPGDMTLDELRQTAEDFGAVIAVKISRGATRDGRTGIVEYQSAGDMRRALQKLDNRRVEGWDRRLHAYEQ